MAHGDSQMALDGHVLALLLLVTFLCQVPVDERECGAQQVLLLYIIRGIEEVDSPPPSLADFRTRISSALHAYPNTLELIGEYVDMAFESFDSTDGINELFQAKLPDCLQPFLDEGATPLLIVERRSYIGLYIRRARLAFEMLLHDERMTLSTRAAEWRDSSAGLADQWRSGTHAGAYRAWRDSARSGDYAATKASSHAFFDLTLPGCDQELHQHAMLNLAKFFLDTEGYAAARTTLDEAIRIARTVGDTECMRACDGLLVQLAGMTEHGELTYDTLSSGSYAPLTLWCAERERVKKATPLLCIIQRIFDSVWASRTPGVGAPDADWEPRPSIERQSACPSALLSRTWLDAGVPALLVAYADHVDRLKVRPPRNMDDLALSTAATRALHAAECANYDEALSLLLRVSIVRRVTSFARYKEWHKALWDVMRVKARRRRDRATLRALDQLSDEPAAADALSAVCSLKDSQQPYQSLETLMATIATSERQHLFPLQRTGLTELADLMVVSLDMTKDALRTIEAVLPQALADHNIERRGHAESVYAKCLLATGDVAGASRWLERAGDHFSMADCYSEEATVRYLEARLAHNRGDTILRDAVAERYNEVRTLELAAAHGEPDEMLATVEKLVCAVGQSLCNN
ncbi:hypothetical protein MCUN1_000734 [Malassezia cuniculi]|uniref:Anaphase-promoting complex subunit 5 n=1 Tax=Malassezia cuniculi TaxID=948313 RepID=A0AAF0EWE7_9BASI|nr:hypothetical protein MCUN1_000734 [Malassezia cuniculi]